MANSSDCFRTEILVAIGWSASLVTLRVLAEMVGASLSKVRYHIQVLAKKGQVCLTKDSYGRILIGLPKPVVTAPKPVVKCPRGPRRALSGKMGGHSVLHIPRRTVVKVDSSIFDVDSAVEPVELPASVLVSLPPVPPPSRRRRVVPPPPPARPVDVSSWAMLVAC
jgi:hypothetical protein